MNRERAETHLRLLVETGLRQAAARPVPSPADKDPARWTHTRLACVTQALSTVHAVDDDTVEEILADFDLALTARQPGGLSEGTPGPVSRRHHATLMRRAPTWAGTGVAGAAFTTSLAMSAPMPQPPSPSQPLARSAPWRVVPVGQVIRIDDDGARGEMHLLAFAQTADAAQLSVASWMDIPERSASRPSWPHLSPFQQLTATDDQGVGYHLGFSGGSSSGGNAGLSYAEWEGALELHPYPPHQIRWLDLSAPGEHVTRIDLDPPIPPPNIAVSEQQLASGEVLLDRIAVGLLAGDPGLPNRSSMLTSAIITALRAADVLPLSSPVPGQLAWLCAALEASDRGATTPPAGVPEPWLSLLAYRQRPAPGAPVPAPSGAAAVAVELPELDGARIAVLGLHNGRPGTSMHLLATGVAMENWPDIRETGSTPALWLRDDGGQWHATRMNGFSSRESGENIVRLAVVPPLDRGTAWLELRVAGQLAQVSATLPLRWT